MSQSFVDTMILREAARRSPWSLEFPRDLEQEYLASMSEPTRVWVRMSVLVALATTLGFAVIDHFVLARPSSPIADTVRFGIQLPVVFLFLALTTKRLFDRWYRATIAYAATAFGLGTVVMAAAAPPEYVSLITGRLLLAVFYFYFMLGLGYRRSLAINACVFAGYLAITFAGIIEPRTATYTLFVLFCANLIGCCGAFALERANRATFLEKRRLVESATRDGLTGLLNRAALDERMRSLGTQAARDGVPLAVVLVDIDHFKAYNDRYGHPAGDQCLRVVASAVKHAARRRPLDLVGRYGGEELVAVLYGASREHAESVARSIVVAVARLAMPHAAAGMTADCVTVSVGAASGPVHDPDALAALVQRADEALYEAKSSGRNRHATAPPVVAADAPCATLKSA